MFPLVFASSAFVPVDSMPGWLQAFAQINPVTITVNALRAHHPGGAAVASLAVRRYRHAAG